MSSRRSTRRGETVLIVSAAAALAFGAGGCGRGARAPEPVSPPAVDIRVLEEQHPFARLTGVSAVPRWSALPEGTGGTSGRLREGRTPGPDIRAVEKGLRGRADALAQRYGENVLRREMDSARLAARVDRAAAEAGLEREIEQVRIESEERAAAIRREAGPQRNALQLRLAALDSRLRASLWEAPSGLTEERERVARQIRELEEGTESRIRELERETAERMARMRAAFERRMAREEEDRVRSARQRALEQARRKRQEAEALLEEVSAQLRARSAPPRPGDGLPVFPERAAAAGSPEFGSAEASVRRKVREDARLSAELARETAQPGSSAATVRSRAGKLLGGRP
jgi:hypothetical protein